MLQEPCLSHAAISDVLRDQYQLSVQAIAFLPLGADPNTAVYRVATQDNNSHFLKLRSGHFDDASVAVPKYLRDRGMKNVIPALTTRTGALAASLGAYTVILYPYVEGRNAIEGRPSEAQWIELGAALKRFHTSEFPPAITQGLPRENFATRWRDELRMFLRRIERETFREPVAAELAAFLSSNASETLELVDRAQRFARLLEQLQLDHILCHGDIHGWNLLIDDYEDLYIVDWDTLIFAPKERDLMFIGAGLGETGYPPEEEDRLFYLGYGPTHVNQTAIAYYRFERIVEDIAVYCEQVFDSAAGPEDRRQAVENVKANSLPGSSIDRAYHAAAASKAG